MQTFRTLPSGVSIAWGRGRIDSWCVYIHEDGGRRAPLDTEYFDHLNSIGAELGATVVYDQFVQLWQMASGTPDPSANALVDSLVSSHPPLVQFDSTQWYTVIYMAMVSEENYPGTRLGKRLKRLGVHQFLLEGMPVIEAANWSRGKPWRQLDAECTKRGF